MKKSILLFILLFTQALSYNSTIKAAYAIGIFDSSGRGENIQHLKKTKADYNGTCFTKVFVVGTNLRIKPTVKIGNSLGHYQSSKPIFNNRKLKIGEVMIFKHYAVSKGLLRIEYKNKLLDSKVFIN